MFDAINAAVAEKQGRLRLSLSSAATRRRCRPPRSARAHLLRCRRQAGAHPRRLLGRDRPGLAGGAQAGTAAAAARCLARCRHGGSRHRRAAQRRQRAQQPRCLGLADAEPATRFARHQRAAHRDAAERAGRPGRKVPRGRRTRQAAARLPGATGRAPGRREPAPADPKPPPSPRTSGTSAPSSPRSRPMRVAAA